MLDYFPEFTLLDRLPLEKAHVLHGEKVLYVLIEISTVYLLLVFHFFMGLILIRIVRVILNFLHIASDFLHTL